jgi:hypothetical protein
MYAALPMEISPYFTCCVGMTHPPNVALKNLVDTTDTVRVFIAQKGPGGIWGARLYVIYHVSCA